MLAVNITSSVGIQHSCTCDSLDNETTDISRANCLSTGAQGQLVDTM